MIGMARMAKHNAIEPLVICKLTQLFKPEPLAIHFGNRGQMIGGPGDP
ncbi:hypothetical protein L581_0346 [Serratia fonticola AU-AP2C]|nr:hypothetical protein L581_0346 [Serratia fonticola AU-AP2C]